MILNLSPLFIGLNARLDDIRKDLYKRLFLKHWSFYPTFYLSLLKKTKPFFPYTITCSCPLGLSFNTLCTLSILCHHSHPLLSFRLPHFSLYWAETHWGKPNSWNPMTLQMLRKLRSWTKILLLVSEQPLPTLHYLSHYKSNQSPGSWKTTFWVFQVFT